MIDVLELCSLWILTLLYYQYRQVQLILTSTITYPSLSLVKCGTLYKGMMLSHAIISKLGGNREEQGFCPLPFISRYFRALCFWKSAFLLGRHNSAIGIFMA